MKISEIFVSINGESQFSGLRTVFVRSHSCNLRCNYCFGPNKYGKYPSVTLPDLTTKPLNEVEIGDTILTFDEKGDVAETKVVNVLTHVSDDYRVLSTNSTSFVVTPDHPFFLNDQWVPAKDIKVHDRLKNATTKDYYKYILSCYSDAMLAYAEECLRIYEQEYEVYSNSGIVNAGRNNPHVVTEPSNYDKLKNCIAKGIAGLDIIEGVECNNLVVHHIDENHNNDDIHNLAIVSNVFHNRIHARGQSFWAKDTKVKPFNGAPVLRNNSCKDFMQIGRYPKEFINITCAPYNTYLINDVYVHNCDSLYAIEGNDYRNMTVLEILKEVEQFNCRRVTFTGGEPLLQKDALELVEALVRRGYTVEIETNGAVDIEPYNKMDNVVITMDWKCPTSGMNNRMLDSNLHKLRPTDVIKFVVGSHDDLLEMERIDRMTEAQSYVSPVFGAIELEDIANYLIANHLNNIRFQLQIHKCIFNPNARGV